MHKMLALIITPFLAATASAEGPLRDGDIIFQTSGSGQSAAIQRATHSPYSVISPASMFESPLLETVATR
jgi:hypothetical protein